MSGALARTASGIAQAGQIAGSIGTLAGDIGALSAGGGDFGGLPGLGPWADNLQPASWNGVSFVVKTAGIRRGRRVVVHEYAYRDSVWVEDLGRGVRTLSFSGFLVGDDVYAQRDAMLAAAEAKGAGQLVHPSLGSISVSLTECSANERFDLGRVVEIEFAFIDAGQDAPQNPSIASDTQGDAIDGADEADDASQSDFLNNAASSIQIGADVVQAGVATAQGWVSAALGLVGDATRAVNAVSGLGALVGGGAYFGRYNVGALAVIPANLAPISQSLTVVAATEAATAQVLSASIVAATAAQTAAQGFTTAMAAFTPAAPAGPSAIAEAIRSACINPADAVRLLSSLAQYFPTITQSTSPIGGALAIVQTATASLCRRAALAALARATSTYQPSSYNDAVTILAAVTALIDAEAEIAADADDDQTYLALQTMRARVIVDLITRGSTLPLIVTINRPASLPALFLAYQLYQDSTRSWDLIARADPIHPAFMPILFEAPAT